MKTIILRTLAVPLFVLLLATANGAAASLMFNVSLSTSALIGNPAGPFSIDVQLNDGSGSNDANNMASISNIAFGGGTAVGPVTALGGATGNWGSGIHLVDSSFLNLLDQAFTPGSRLSFDLALTTNVDAGLVPDELSLSLLDATGNPLPTTGLLSAFLVVDIATTQPVVQTFAGSGGFSAIGAPVITPIAAPPGIPEPGTAWLIVLGFALLAARAGGQQRTAARPPR